MEYSKLFNNSIVQALPNWNHPRLLIASGSISEMWVSSSILPASRILGKIQRNILRILCCLNILEKKYFEENLELCRYFQEFTKEFRVSAVIIGMQGNSKKFTLQIRDTNGNIIGYLKYGDSENAIKRLIQENNVLTSLPAGIAPTVLKFGKLGNGIGLFTSYIPGKPIFSNQAISKFLMNYLDKLEIDQNFWLLEHPWIKWIQRCSGNDLSWTKPLNKKKWQVVFTHGDFAPWNLLLSKDRGLIAVDWEYGCIEGFPFIDFIYFHLQNSCLIEKKNPKRAVIELNRKLTQCFNTLSEEEARILIKLTGLYVICIRKAEGYDRSDHLYTWWSLVFNNWE